MKKVFVVLLTFFIVITNYALANAELKDINAKSCILIDYESGEVLYEKDADLQHMYPASTTKIMTAILALEKGTPDQLMTASQAAVHDIGKDGMNIGIMAGEQITLEYLLKALLITSANETANIIAENICSTRQEFVDLMNEKAKELGADNTHFVNPCGAHEDDHYTTARDLATIARYAMSIPAFREIIVQKSCDMMPTNKHDSWPTLYSTNKLLSQPPNELFEVNGIKTGYTVPAGFCLVSSGINSEGLDLIAVVLNSKERDSSFDYSNQLLEYGFTNFSKQKIIESGSVVEESLYVESAKDNEALDLIAAGSVESLLPVDRNNWNLDEKIEINPYIYAPIIKGEVLGHIEYSRNGVLLGKVDLVASKSIEKAFIAKTIDTVKETVKEEAAGSSIYASIAKGAAITLFCFLLLRFILKRISRKMNSRKYRY